jgi:hypothetical protein
MEMREVLSRVIGLFTADELKALGKQIDLKGMSKLNKGDLIKAIITQTPEEAMGRLVSGEGKKKIQEIIKNAFALLSGASIATERLGSIKIQGDDVAARFDGMQWTTQCSTKIPHAGAPEFDHACTCKAAEYGALCVHFWAVLLRLLAEERLPISTLGPFVDLAGDTIESGLKSVKSKISRPSQNSGDASSKPFDQLLQSWTIEGRYERAMEELGRGVSVKPIKPAKLEKLARAARPEKPAKPPAAQHEGDAGDAKPTRKAKKAPAEPYHVEVRFSKQEPGPPAKILAVLAKVTGEGKETLPFHLFIDEAEQVVAHDGCMDFDMRLRRKQLLCKHLLQVFVSMDEQIARRLLGNLGKFEFTNIMPNQKDAPLTLPEAIRRLKPDVRVADNDALKGAIMDYLLANDGTPDNLSVDAIKANAGEGAYALLPTMVAEGMIEEFSPGHFRPR